MDMTYEERCRRQQVVGIVNMVYDICERYGEQPTTWGLITAISNWMECEITPQEGKDKGNMYYDKHEGVSK